MSYPIDAGDFLACRARRPSSWRASFFDVSTSGSGVDVGSCFWLLFWCLHNSMRLASCSPAAASGLLARVVRSALGKVAIAPSETQVGLEIFLYTCHTVARPALLVSVDR